MLYIGTEGFFVCSKLTMCKAVTDDWICSLAHFRLLMQSKLLDVFCTIVF